MFAFLLLTLLCQLFEVLEIVFWVEYDLGEDCGHG